MKLTMHIENVYPGDTVEAVKVVDVPPLTPGEDVEDWAYDHLFPHTGTGRTHGEAGYFVSVTACDEDPALVGAKFEWGT